MKPSLVVLCTFAMSCCLSIPGNAQVDPNQAINAMPVNVALPKTPEVTMFEKFIQNPVSPHTGLHAINIPVHTIELKGKQLPIGLKYHSSGIKVDDIASEVGLGWALEAGGVISTNVNGISDLGAGQWPNSHFQQIKDLSFTAFYQGGLISIAQGESLEDPLDQFFDVNPGDHVNYLKDVTRGLDDSQPDMYNMGGPGLSAQFFLDESQQWRTVPYQNVKIEQIGGGFRVTDEAGTIYSYSLIAQSGTTTWPASTGGYANVFPPNIGHNSYYLTTIVTQLKDTVIYYYTSYSYTDETEIRSRSVLQRGALAACRDFLPNERTELLFSHSAVAGQRLDSVIATNGDKVVFNYSAEARKDIATNVFTRLEHIDIYKKVIKEYAKLKRFSLAQTYQGQGAANDPLRHRLMLNSAGEVGKPPYVFTYDPTPLPRRHDFSQDHLGNYNGKENSTLLPADVRNNFPLGADREFDMEFATAGILKSIKYPTGGTLDFEYEPHQYWLDAVVIDSAASVFLSSSPNSVKTVDFEVTLQMRDLYLLWNNTDDGTTSNNEECNITLTGPNNYLRIFHGHGSSENETLTLPVGTYTITIENIGNMYYGDLSVLWSQDHSQSARNTTRGTGGLRIRKVKNCADNSPCIEQTYHYVMDDGLKSSGVLFQTPQYVQTTEKNFRQASGVSVNCTVQSQSASSVLPLVNNSGAHIGYRQVTIVTGNSALTGKTVMKFKFDNSSNYSTAGFPFPPVITYDWLNGLPNEVTEYAYVNGDFEKKRRVKNHYLYDNLLNRPENLPNQYYTYGAKIALQFYPYVMPNVDPLQSLLSHLSFGIARYKFVSSWHYLTSTEEIQYVNDEDSLVTSISYERAKPEHTQVTKITTENSTGQILETRLKYPLDYPASSNAIISSMQDKHMANSVIEGTKTLTRNNTTTITSSDLILYTENNTSVIPKKHMTLELASPIPFSSLNTFNGVTHDVRYKEQVNYAAFDSSHNVTEYTDRSGMVRSIIWGYNRQLPVAEVTNATRNHVAFTSFESDKDGGWTVTPGRVNDDAITGSRCLDLTSRSMTKDGLTATEKYMVSLWVKTGASVTLTGGTVSGPTITHTSGSWVRHLYEITNASVVTLQGTGRIDEVRLHPKNAIMKTYTHRPGIGIQSEADLNSLITFYEYDELNRLSLTRDNKGNIIKRFSYHYKEQ